MEDFGFMWVELLVVLIVVWILVYFCLWKGIKFFGKVVYFIVIFFYFVLFILLICGVILEGVGEGVIFYFKLDFIKLKNF